MPNLRCHKAAQIQVQAQHCSGSDSDTNLESESDYEPCTSDESDDSDNGCRDRCYSNSTHQVEYTDISDYEDAATESEDEHLAEAFAVSTIYLFFGT